MPSHGWFMTLFSPHGRILRFLSRSSSTGRSFQVLKIGKPWEAAKIHGETIGIPSRLNMTHGFTMNLRNIAGAFQITSDEDPIWKNFHLEFSLKTHPLCIFSTPLKRSQKGVFIPYIHCTLHPPWFFGFKMNKGSDYYPTISHYSPVGHHEKIPLKPPFPDKFISAYINVNHYFLDCWGRDYWPMNMP